MKHSLNQKVVVITQPQAIVDNAGFTTAAIDTLGFAQLTIIVILGALDIALTGLKLRESDDDSAYSDVSGGDYSVSSTLPAATDDNKVYAFHVDLRGRKRYIDLSMTGGDGTAGTYASAVAVLSRASEAPSTAAERGFAAELFV